MVCSKHGPFPFPIKKNSISSYLYCKAFILTCILTCIVKLFYCVLILLCAYLAILEGDVVFCGKNWSVLRAGHGMDLSPSSLVNSVVFSLLVTEPIAVFFVLFLLGSAGEAVCLLCYFLLGSVGEAVPRFLARYSPETKPDTVMITMNLLLARRPQRRKRHSEVFYTIAATLKVIFCVRFPPRSRGTRPLRRRFQDPGQIQAWHPILETTARACGLARTAVWSPCPVVPA